MYDTVFDLQRTDYSEWWFPAIGISLALVFGLILYYRERLARQRPSQMQRVIAWAVLCVVGLWTLWAFQATYGEYRRLIADLNDGRVKVVEGMVSNFVPMPPQGHALETFEVSGQTFCYSDNSVGPGFKNTAIHGGPIRNGLGVRITHVDGVIVRLEIANEQPKDD